MDHEAQFQRLVRGRKYNFASLSEIPDVRGVYILWLDQQQTICLKVGAAGIRQGSGLRNRIAIHYRSNEGNSVLAKHMKADRGLAELLGDDFEDRSQRRAFLRESPVFQVLPVVSSGPSQLRALETYVEGQTRPRYSGRVGGPYSRLDRCPLCKNIVLASEIVCLYCNRALQGGPADSATLVRRALPYHEAGHAMMALLLGRPFTEVNIVSTKGALGSVEFLLRLNARQERSHYTQQEMRVAVEDVLIGFAGPVATVTACRVHGWELDGITLPNVMEMVNESSLIDDVLAGGDELRAVFISGQLWERADWIIKDHLVWEAIERIASELGERKRVQYASLVELLEGSLARIRQSQLGSHIFGGT